MQGFILDVKKAKNEDTIVSILTLQKVKTLYRFYGARHPIVTTGFKVDFEIERDASPFLPRLRNIIHLGYPWLGDFDRLRIWQQFVTLLYHHLKDVEIPGKFYFQLLNDAASTWHLQNPKRNAVEFYLKLLQHEGRLHDIDICFACGKPLGKEVSLIRAYLPAHPECVIAQKYPAKTIQTLFKSLNTIFMEDEEVEKLWLTLTEGM